MGHFSQDLYIVRYKSISVLNGFPLYKKPWIPDLFNVWKPIFFEHSFFLNIVFTFWTLFNYKKKIHLSVSWVSTELRDGSIFRLPAWIAAEKEMRRVYECPAYSGCHADVWACQGWRSSVRSRRGFFWLKRRIKWVFSRVGVFFHIERSLPWEEHPKGRLALSESNHS